MGETQVRVASPVRPFRGASRKGPWERRWVKSPSLRKHQFFHLALCAKRPQRWRARRNGYFHRLKISQLNTEFKQINEAHLLLYFFRQVWKETRIYGSLVSGCIVWLYLGNRTASSDLGVFTWSLGWCPFQLDLRCSLSIFQTRPWFMLHLQA